jgi:uncharacterized protein
MRLCRAQPRRVCLLALGFLLAALAGSATNAETPIPESPARWVTDRAAFLSPAAAAELDSRLAAYQGQTGHQVLVYLDHTTGGVPIEDWAVKAFEKWKIGRKGLDDGAALFVFSDDRKLRIEVGYGLEDRVTDALASRIINQRMVPLIRAGDRDGAVRVGVAALLGAIGAPPGTGRAVAESPASRLSLGQIIFGAILVILIIGFAITHPGLAWLMLMSIGSGRGGGGLSGGGGGGGGFSGGGGRSGGGGASGSW